VVAETHLVSGLSGRYAIALFDLAQESGELDSVAADLDRLDAMMADSADLTRLVRSPALSRKDQGLGMAVVMEKAEFSGLTRRFVGLVASNRRLFALADITRAFRTLLSSHRGEVTATVTSAQALNDAQLNEITNSLAKAVASEVKVTASVDASLIGGLIVKVGSRMIDSSLRTKLQNLQLAMKGVG